MCEHYVRELKKENRHYIDAFDYNNCVLCLANEHPDGMTQAEIANFLGLSKMRICQIEHQALNKLDKKMKKVLQPFLTSI